MKHINEKGYHYILKELDQAVKELDTGKEININLAKYHINNAIGTLKANKDTKPRKTTTKFVNEERW